ncbi:probable beta-1,3-galactosyltransferase 4 [Raphanus sativus]|uniref:Probable beta-1,3-galactosyltransferase 4 n=1 Tax=Raphanus sativus TaxID=3726 RepID=A0A9W3D612_RAPSA|nr:probable beta-1,3-galactosyltransferase 4 [Raphanus sativus]
MSLRQHRGLKVSASKSFVSVSDSSARELSSPTATLGAELARYRMKARFYIGCMKSGLFLLGMRYHEPEYWKFGEEGR